MKDLSKYQGIFPAFYACYDEKGDISPERVRALTEYLIGKGVTGLYVGGSSGECIYQSVAERKLLLENVMEVAKGKLTIIAHVACNNTADSRELAEIYTAADVLFNPTRQDNFPTVNMEALACGTPVAAFQTGGSTEVIDDKCGASLSDNNAEQAIEYLRGVQRKSKQTAAYCASRATDFDENKCFEMFVDLCFRKQLGDNE